MMVLPHKEHLRSLWKQYIRFLAIHVQICITQGREKSRSLMTWIFTTVLVKEIRTTESILKNNNKIKNHFKNTDFSILTVTMLFSKVES